MVHGNYFYLKIIICLHTVIWFQVTNNKQSRIQSIILNTNNLQLYIKYSNLIQIIFSEMFDTLVRP